MTRPAGNRRDLPGGLTLTQDSDQRGRLTRQALTRAGSPLPEGPAVIGQTLQRSAYTYSPDGLVTGIDDLLAGDRTIGLDRAGRVTTVTGQDWAEQYAYDQAGNVTSASWPVPPPRQPPPGSTPKRRASVRSPGPWSAAQGTSATATTARAGSPSASGQGSPASPTPGITSGTPTTG